MTRKPEKEDRSWRDNEFARHEVFAQWWWLVIPAIGLFTALLSSSLSWFKRQAASEVVIYAAQDQVYAEPILQAFEKETGVRVLAVYDSEAVKTVGLANRLIAERSHPQCDIFWGNEEMRTCQLAAKDVFRETNGWAAFGYRSRRIVINTNIVVAGVPPAAKGGILPPGSSSDISTRSELSNAVPPGATPGSTAGRMPAATSLCELTNAVWHGKVALAYPQFGTTATHFHVLRQQWGDAEWQIWCRALAANKPFLVDGNSVVVKTVGRGEAWIGLTDSDDIAAGQSEGLPIAALPLTPSLSPSDGERVAEGWVRGEMLLIPNTVGVIRGAPHPVAAQQLFEYLQRREIAEQLVRAQALEGVSMSEVTTPTLKPDWAALLRDLEKTTAELNQIFLR